MKKIFNFCPKINLPQKPSFYLILIIFIGLVIRVPYLSKYHYVLNMDEAVFGIMAQDIINGKGIPLFFYGQAYFGPLEAIFAVPFFLIFSPSTLILRISVLVLTLLALVLFWRGLRVMVRDSNGLTLMGWLTVSPLVLSVRSIHPSGHMGGLFCGSLVFYLAVRVITSPRRNGLNFFLWGLASGFGLWMHPGTLTYIIAGGCMILLNDFRIFRNFPLSILGCLAGGFPFWIKTISLRYATFNFGQTKLNGSLLLPFIKDMKQSLTNMNTLLGYDIFPKFISLTIWGCIIFLLLFSFFLFLRRRKGRFSREELVLVFAWLVIILTLFAYSYIQARRFGYVSYRYYIPMLIGLALIFDIVLTWVGKRSPNLRLLLFLFLIIINIGTNFLGFKNQLYFRYEFLLGESYTRWKSLPPFLEQKGIKEAYINFFEEGPLNFISRGKMIFSDFYDSRYPLRSQAVDGSLNPAFIFQDPKEAELFKQGLGSLGNTRYSFFQSPGHIFFYNIKAPEDVYTPIDRDKILISTHPNHQWSRFLLDGNMATKWSTDGVQKGDEFISLDLQKEIELARVDLVPPWLDTYPIHIRIETSLDNRRWTVVTDREISNTLFWAGPHPGYKVWEGFFQFIFRGQRARYVRIKQTGHSPMPWELAEIFLYTSRPGEQAVSSIDWESITAFLKKQGIKSVVSDLFFSPNIMKYSQGEVRATPRYNGAYPDLRVRPGYSPDQIEALSIHQRDRAEVIAFLNRNQWQYQVQPFGEYTLFHHLINPLPFTRQLDIREAALTTSHNQKDTLSMIDKNRNSRWTSLTPRETGMFIHCDLKKIQKISALILDPGPHIQDIANDLDLFYSLDGLHYQKIDQKGRFHQHFRWTGSHLIGSGTSSAYIFLPIEARYLKIVCRENNNSYYWSIGELEILGPPEGS
ncbi:MAG: hypothetical protein A2Y79_12900 [Deltaproteobacteria bacterium RBG_13_43_22]|nr:MAG: hypothetical protein A2Y79_12900 [Deltaproteobacteria bacterium RBG_13_43_22]